MLNKNRFGQIFVLVAIFCTSMPMAWAQDSAAVDIQNFSPALGPNAIFSTESADTLSHLKFSLGGMLNYSSRPLISEQSKERTTAIVDQQLGLHLMGGIGLFDRLQLDLAMPLYMVNEGTFNGQDFGGFTTGDFAMRLKGHVVSSKKSPVGLGLMLEARAPTGDSDAFTSSGEFSALPKVLVDGRIGDVLLTANVGTLLRSTNTIRNLDVGHELHYGAGAQVTLMDGLLALGGELYGRTNFSAFFSDLSTSPLEGVLGLKLHTPSGFSIISGAGGGLVEGFGSPEFRAFIGLVYASEGAPESPKPKVEVPKDADEDGIVDSQDQCIDRPEDFDQFQDEDGCPDPDNDGDGLLDDQDECKNEKGTAAHKGCPTKDKDGDTILDAQDKCPDEAEDVDGFEDKDGCPELDNDKDNVADAQDKCPDEAEDVDGFEDKDGCPEPDNDKDGILDAQDTCPNKAETYNGHKDEDGCPDGKALVQVTEDKKIEIYEKIFFKKGKASILKKSYNILDVITVVLKQNPQIQKVRIEGHTDDQGKDDKNLKLSDARAKSVQAYLEKKGIASKRLEYKGFGEEQPSCKDIPELSKTRKLARKNRKALKACRALNRRVEFNILDIPSAKTLPPDPVKESSSSSSPTSSP